MAKTHFAVNIHTRKNEGQEGKTDPVPGIGTSGREERKWTE
jgi:hypothetical protein